MKQCLVVTENKHKLAEIKVLLSALDVEIVSYADILGRSVKVIEDGATFEDNAIKKIHAMPPKLKGLLLADDSGLEVDALAGRPGVYSARFGGERLSDRQRCEHLLAQLEGVSDRSARFVCVIAIQSPDRQLITVRGVVEGCIAYQVQGDHGFGYDPIFIPTGYDRSFSVLGPDIKHQMSHRSRALKQAANVLQPMLSVT